MCSLDKLVSDEEVLLNITKLFRALFSSDLGGQRDVLQMLSSSSLTDYQAAVGEEGPSDPGRVMFDTMGFAIERRPSSLQSAGTGVFVVMGTVPKGATVAMYPGRCDFLMVAS